MVILWLIIGLLLFFMGIKSLSKITPNMSTIKSKGDNFKNLIWVFTLGIVLTIITQSSSAIGVIILVFLDKKQISFKQGAFFLAGGNIGTTVSGQIYALPTERLIIPLLILSVCCFIIGKFNNKFNAVSRYLFAILMIFLGLQIISSITIYYKEEFAMIFERFNSMYQAFITGIILTSVSQSSSLIIGILIVMASKGIVTLEYAVASVLGLNIGTSTTLLLACIGLNKGGKKGAVFQVVYNSFCALAVFSVFPFYTDLLLKYSHSSSHYVANAHTLFNIGGIIILIFGWKLIESVVNWIVDFNGEKQS